MRPSGVHCALLVLLVFLGLVAWSQLLHAPATTSDRSQPLPKLLTPWLETVEEQLELLERQVSRYAGLLQPGQRGQLQKRLEGVWAATGRPWEERPAPAPAGPRDCPAVPKCPPPPPAPAPAGPRDCPAVPKCPPPPPESPPRPVSGPGPPPHWKPKYHISAMLSAHDVSCQDHTRFLKGHQDPVVVECGAAGGEEAAELSHFAKVHSFEANPANIPEMRETIRRKGAAGQVQWRHAACGNTSGTIHLYVPDKSKRSQVLSLPTSLPTSLPASLPSYPP